MPKGLNNSSIVGNILVKSDNGSIRLPVRRPCVDLSLIVS